MRVILDIVENLTSSLRYIVGAAVIGLMVVGLMLSVGGAYVGTKAVDEFGERAERISEKAIAAEMEARRAEQLAAEGWGHRPRDPDTARRLRDKDSIENGWGN